MAGRDVLPHPEPGRYSYPCITPHKKGVPRGGRNMCQNVLLPGDASEIWDDFSKGRPPSHHPPPIALPATGFRRKIMQKIFIDKPKRPPYTPATKKGFIINQFNYQSKHQEVKGVAEMTCPFLDGGLVRWQMVLMCTGYAERSGRR